MKYIYTTLFTITGREKQKHKKIKQTTKVMTKNIHELMLSGLAKLYTVFSSS